jgi:hypothetical protein
MATVTDNVIIPLTGFSLPRDFAWRVRFIAAVDEQLRRLRSTGHFEAPRFYGFFFQGETPVGVSGNWIVSLDALPLLLALPPSVDRITHGQFNICSESIETVPDFILIFDSRDGSCWLWRFSYGLRFVESTDPLCIGKDGRLGD